MYYIGESESSNINDINGKTKEWFLALIKEIFAPELGMLREYHQIFKINLANKNIEFIIGKFSL